MSGGLRGPDRACPVCCSPADSGSRCPACAWRLEGDHFLGAPVEEDVRCEREALRAARDQWDARATALAARAAVGGVDGESWDRLLAELVAKPDAVLWFVELTAERVGLIKAGTDPNGIPWAEEVGGAAWGSIVPEFAADPAVRAFQLAGGIGAGPPVDRVALDRGVRRLLGTLLPPAAGQRTVLLSERPDWLLPARAAAVVRSLRAPDAQVGPTAGGTAGVRRLLRSVPLRRDHELLLAAVDAHSGAVRPQTTTLFRAGARLPLGETAAVALTVYGGPDEGAVVTLPVLAGHEADADVGTGTRASVVSAHRVSLPGLRPAELVFVLHGPGEVEVRLPDGTAAEPAGTADLAELIDSLPRRLRRPPRLELFLAVELSYAASPDEVVERLGFTRELIAALAGPQGAAARPAVGAVGYYDHGVRESPYAPRHTLLHTVPLGTPGVALAALAEWQPSRRRQDTAAALEDALRAVRLMATPTADAAPSTERRVVVLGGRPPGQPTQHGHVPACPLGVDWRTELAALRTHGIDVLVRRDSLPDQPPTDRVRRLLQQYGAQSWAELGADGSLDQRLPPASVARRLLPAWRAEGPPCGLALAHPLL
ncbi:hypothetical protein ABH930_005036 [Kitasatospora sp. GAS204A]|uniref:hypothetical protein n=1 Tax=unclassified Kitasatospora TaxID=2633591 RepID=UPI0024737E66|nr:hypothetical protein [Kitasatospora sp. GAS204B]MDH6120811.1 hypothetical protein [Kitasatospora sp. GAS204B]